MVTMIQDHLSQAIIYSCFDHDDHHDDRDVINDHCNYNDDNDCTEILIKSYVRAPQSTNITCEDGHITSDPKGKIALDLPANIFSYGRKISHMPANICSYAPKYIPMVFLYMLANIFSCTRKSYTNTIGTALLGNNVSFVVAVIQSITLTKLWFKKVYVEIIVSNMMTKNKGGNKSARKGNLKWQLDFERKRK